jgi:hypothetical protein
MKASNVVTSLDFGEPSPDTTLPARLGFASRVPHLIQISAIGFVAAPHAMQKLLPEVGLAPQPIQISGVPINSFPQFLQNISTPFGSFINGRQSKMLYGHNQNR